MNITDIRSIGGGEWPKIIFFSLIHPLAPIIVLFTFGIFSGLSSSVLASLVACLVLIVFFYVACLSSKFNEWKIKTHSESINEFLHALFKAQFWYIPVGLFNIFLFLTILSASSDSLKSGGDVFGIIYLPIYVVLCIFCIPLSSRAFGTLVKKAADAQV